MLIGESERTGGELAFAKGTRISLHDQRPPLQSGMSLREYALSDARDLIATEEELRALEQAMASGDHGPATLRRYSDAQARLEHAGGYTWRERAAAALRGLGFAERDLDRRLETFSGGEADPRFARPSPRRRSRSACSSTSRRTTSTSRTSSGSSRSSSPWTRR